MNIKRLSLLSSLLALSLLGCQSIAPIQKPGVTADPALAPAAPAQKEIEQDRPLEIKLGNVTLNVTLPIPEHARRAAYTAQAIDSYFYSDVNRLRITVKGMDMTAPVVIDVAVSQGGTTVSRDISLPAGKNRQFLVEAFSINESYRPTSVVAAIRGVSDIEAQGVTPIALSFNSTPTGEVFDKLIDDGRSNGVAQGLAATLDSGTVDTWIKTNLTKLSAGQYANHPSTVDAALFEAYLVDHAGALPPIGNAGDFLLGGKFNITVLNRSDSSVLSDATVTANDLGSATGASFANGVYTLSGVTPGTCSVTVTVPNRVPTSVIMTVGPRGTANATVRLDGDMLVRNYVGGGAQTPANGVSAENATISPAAAAIFGNPSGLTCNYKDLLFFTSGGKIFRVNADRTLTLVANGSFTKLTFDASGNLWGRSSNSLLRFNRQTNGDLSATGETLSTAVYAFTVAADGDVFYQATSGYMYRLVDGTGTAQLTSYPTITSPSAVYDIAIDSTKRMFYSQYSSYSNIYYSYGSPVAFYLGGGGYGYLPIGSDRTSSTTAARNANYLTVDADDNLLYADRNNYSIRKITPAGKVYNVAGTGVAGLSLGKTQLDSTIRFNVLGQYAFDSGNNLYIVDSGNARIYRTYASDGQAAVTAAF